MAKSKKVLYKDKNGKVREGRSGQKKKLPTKKIDKLVTLTPKQRLFVNTLMEMDDPDPTEAAKLAGYSGAQGSSLIKHPKIYPVYKKLLDKRNKESMITGERIVEEIAAIAFLDPTDLFYDKYGMLKVKDLDSLTPMQRKLIDKVVITTDSKMVKGKRQKSQTVTVSSITSDVKLKALQLLMKHKGMLIDKRQEEHVHKINWEDYYKVRQDDAERQSREDDSFRQNIRARIAMEEEPTGEVIDAEYTIDEFLDPEETDDA